MASHGFVGFDKDQTQAVITAVVSLSRQVEDAIAAACDQFKLNLVTTDKVLQDCTYKDEVATNLSAAIQKAQEDLGIKASFDKFSAKVDEAEKLIESTFNKNRANNEEAQQNLKNQAKKAGADVSK